MENFNHSKIYITKYIVKNWNSFSVQRFTPRRKHSSDNSEFDFKECCFPKTSNHYRSIKNRSVFFLTDCFDFSSMHRLVIVRKPLCCCIQMCLAVCAEKVTEDVYWPPNVCKPMHLKCNNKVLLIECWKPGLDARTQFQAFAFLKSDMTSSDPGVWCLRLICLCRG